MLDGGNFKLKEQIRYEKIQGILVSHLKDGVIVIQLPADGPDDRGDLILETDHVIELVIKLALFSNKLDQVTIQSSGRWVSRSSCKNASVFLDTCNSLLFGMHNLLTIRFLFESSKLNNHFTVSASICICSAALNTTCPRGSQGPSHSMKGKTKM